MIAQTKCLNHCWHSTHRVIKTQTITKIEKICCHCGQFGWDDKFIYIRTSVSHGPYFPDGYENEL